MSGLCGCGCGQRTPIATRNNTSKGWVKGRPLKYMRGHRHKRNGPQYIVSDSGCWLWQWAIDARGYGALRRGRGLLKAHRVYFIQANGEIPEGHDIHHTCGNRACVNPAHLEAIAHDEHTRLHWATACAS